MSRKRKIVLTSLALCASFLCASFVSCQRSAYNTAGVERHSSMAVQTAGQDESRQADGMPQAAVNDTGPGSGQQVEPSGSSAQNGPQVPVTVNRAVDEHYLLAALRDRAAAVSSISAVPYVRSIDDVGISLPSMRPNCIFERLGLERGDIVREVDGSTLKTSEDFFDSVLVESAHGNKTILVERRGALVLLKIALKPAA